MRSRRQLLNKLLVPLLYAWCFCCVLTPLFGQFTYFESFTGTTAPGWTFTEEGNAPGIRLTANATPDGTDPEAGAPQLDTVGNGWLRLATTTGNQDNAASLNVDIPSSGNNITVEFDFTMWTPNTNDADGISVFLYDADVAFDTGAPGGSLSYANRNSELGLNGAYIGVGLDVFGNFTADTEGKTGSDPTLDDDGVSESIAFNPNEVALRGPDDSALQDGTGNYYVLAATGNKNYTLAGDPDITSLDDLNGGAGYSLNFESQATRPDQDAEDYRGFQLILDDMDQLTVSIEFGEGSGYTELFTADLSTLDRPENLRVGFGAATGGLIQVHEIRNLAITTTGNTNTFYWADASLADDNLWDTASNWSPASTPADYADVIFSAASDVYPGLDSNDTITVNGGDKTIGGLYFSGEFSYILEPDTNEKFIFNTNTTNHASEINILNNPDSNADHTVELDIEIQNYDLMINNLVNQTLTLTGDVETNGNNIEFETAGTTELSGVISEGADITVRGNGTTILSGNNTYTGTTTVENGILQIENTNALGGTGSDTTIESGGSLALANNITTQQNESVDIAGSGEGGIGALTNTTGSNTWAGQVDLTADAAIGALSGTLTIDGGSNTIDAAGFDLTFNPATGATVDVEHVITDSSGTSNVIMDGAGTTILNSNNTYSGTTTINSGTLQIQNGEALGDTTNATIINNGGTLALSGGITTNNSESLTITGDGDTGKAALWSESGFNLWQGNIAITGGSASFGAASGQTLSIDGVISGTDQDVNINGLGTVIIRDPASYTGATNVNSGTLQFGDAGNRINDASAVTVASGATLDMNNFSDTVGSLAGGGNVILGSATLTAGDDDTDTTFSGIISGTGDFVKSGSGTTIFSGSNTFNGELSIDEGTVTIGADNTFSDILDISLNGGTLSTNGFADTLDNLTLDNTSTLDFMGTSGGQLTFDDITRNTGTLTINNWNGSLSGNGGNSLQVTAASLGGSFIDNVTFTGWGGAELIDLGSGLFEVVPTLDDFFIWDGSANNRWTRDSNWQLIDGSEPANNPDANGDKVYFGDLDTGLNGSTIQLRTDISIGVMVIDNDDTFTISSNNNNHEFFINNNGSEAVISVLDSAAPTINRELRLQDDLLIANNSTGTLTFNDSNAGFDIITDSSGTNTVTFDGSGTTVVNSQITGAGNVIKNGTGSISLNDNNTFTGGFAMNAGTVVIGNNGAFGTGTLDINGGTISAEGADRTIDETYNINGDFTVGNSDNSNLSFTGTGTVTAGNRTITVENNITLNIDGDLGGTGGLVKDGDGTLDIDGNDTNFTGGLTVNSGTVSTSAADQLVLGATSTGNNYLGAGDITVNTNGTLNATLSGANDITLASGGTLSNTGGSITLTNADAGADFQHQGTLDIDGGTTTIDVGGQYTVNTDATLDVSAGTLNINADAAFLTQGTSTNPATLSVSNSGTVNVDISGGTDADFTLAADDSINVDGSGANFNVTGDAASDVLLNGTVLLSDGGTLTVVQGETTLDTTTVLNGGTATNKGTLEVRGDLNIQTPSLANAPNITVNNSIDTEIAAVSGTQSIENIGTLTKAGTGTTTIATSVNNIQAGLIDIQAGTLLNATNDQIENNTGLRLSGGTWNTGGFDEVLGTLTLSDDSVIDLDSGDSIIEFSNSSGESWDNTKFVIIDNWSGDFANGGGTDQILFDAAGLTSDQLTQVVFRNPVGLAPGLYGAQFIGNEIVPVPEPGTILMGILSVAGLYLFERKRRLSKQ